MSGGNMLDLSGWSEITCMESDVLREQISCHGSDGEGVVLSSLTDPDGSRSGMKVVYTEWGRNGVAELRDYGWHDERGCLHYIPAAAPSPDLMVEGRDK